MKRVFIWLLLSASLSLGLASSARAIVVGDSVSVDISIFNVTDLYAFQFRVDFDPLVLFATGVTEGPFLSSTGPTFFIPGTIDNTAGTIGLTADTLIGLVPGISGSGALAIVDFIAAGAGTSPINLRDVVLLNSGLIEIPALIGQESVTVLPAPEPGSLELLITGMIVLVCLPSRRSSFKRGHRAMC